MLNSPINDTAVSDLPDDQARLAASLISTSKQVGAALGVAIAGAIIAAHPGDPITTAFATRGSIVWSTVALCGAAILTLALPRKATSSAPSPSPKQA
jgi:predicted MFS family arabinose efflux permease